MANNLQCAVCGKAASLTCGACRSVTYCSKSHQKQDWKKGHKAKCKPYRIAINPILGRHLIATRDIQPGEIIFTESPLIYGPKMSSQPVCLGCHKLLPAPKTPSTNYYKCRRCAWPMCSKECEISPHHLLECNLMVARHYRAHIDYYPYQQAAQHEAAYCVVLPLRCMLMREHDPFGYQRFIELQDHLATRIKTPLYNVLRANLVTFVQTILGLVEWDELAILRIAGILDTNAFELRTHGARLRSIYPTAAMISHDCLPNARHTFNATKQIIFFAKVKINKGEIISTSYTQPLKNTLTRRAHLWQAKCFHCACKRCSDFSEIGTFAGAITCSQCKVGKIVSSDALNSHAYWQCQLCPHKLKAENIISGNEAIQNDIAKLDKTTPHALEDFLRRYSDLLHPTNSFVLEVKYALTQLYGRIPGFALDEMDLECLHRKMELCRDLLEVADVFDGGLSIFRGALLLDLYETTLIYVRRQSENDLISPSEVNEQIGEADAYMKEINEIIKIDPEFKNIFDQRSQLEMVS